MSVPAPLPREPPDRPDEAQQAPPETLGWVPLPTTLPLRGPAEAPPRAIMTDPADPADLPAQLWELWRQGQRPDPAAFLARAEPVDLETRVAVLRVDQQQRWLAGERVPAERYFALYPQLLGDDDCAFELIYCEYLVREELGDGPTLQEFLDRFPQFSERLQQQIELHAAIDASHATSVESVLEGSDQPTVQPARAGLPRTAPSGYELVRELGRGGMGIVYEALEQRTGKHVALKVMQWFDPEVLYRFKQEFRALSRFSHPNLVSLHELTAEGAVCFFTMELIDGQPFAQHVRGQAGRAAGSLSPAGCERLRAALAQLADGLNALHAAGVVHRDVKPGNVLVTPAGRVVLLDFGLAAEVDRTGHYLSLQPRLLGTLAYMAPEQAACKPVSPASDWYAVGVMLFEALTGRLPFEGAPFDLLLRKQHFDAPSAAALAPGLPDDLVRLCSDLLRRDPTARPSGAEVCRRLGSPGETTAPAPPAGEILLVGRRQEQMQLAGAFERMRQGRTVIVSLHGRSGAGKSALLKRFLDDLGAGGDAVVLAGRCYEQESVPFKALDNLIDSLSHYLESLPRLSVEALLPRDVGPLARLFPVLGHIEAVAAAPRRPAEVNDPGELRRRAVAALRELLGRLGDRAPLVLAIDDLQWGDEDSTAVLAELLLPPDPPALLLLAAYRSEDAASPCLRGFAALGAGEGVDRVDVPVDPLPEEERRELVQALLAEGGPVSPGEVEAIARQSGGFPFFIHELARFLRDGREAGHEASGPAGDQTLSSVLWARVQRLPSQSRRLLEVLAVAGRPLELALALRATGVDGDALAPLRVERLVRKASSCGHEEIETYHDRIREAVVLHLAPDVQAGHHRALAGVLEDGAAVEPEWKAVHLLGAGEPARAGRYFIQAADRAAAALAFDRAARMYRQALDLLDDLDPAQRRDLGARLANALAQARRGAEAAREYLAAADGASPSQALDLRRRAALMLLSSGHVDAGVSTLREVLASVGLHLVPLPRRAFWSLLWQRLRLRLRGLGFRRRAESAIPAEELARLDVCMTAAVGLSMVDMIQGAHFQSRSLLLALRAGEPVRLASALAREGGHESIAGTRSPRRAARLLDAAEVLASELGEPYPLAMVALSRGVSAALAGEWALAQQLGERAERLLREECSGVLWELGTALRFTLWPLVYQGKLAEVSQRLPGLIQEARDHDDLYGETNLCLVVRTFLRLAEDEPARARRELHELMGRWSHQGFHVQHMNRLFDDAQIDLYEGKAEAAWQRLEGHWPLVERSHLLRVQQVRIFLGHLRARAAVACGAGGMLRRATRLARALWREKAAWAQALARLVEAGVASRLGERETAKGLLREGAARCDAAGMGLHAASARLLLGEKAAEAWMRQQRVVRPERLAALLVPGAWQSSGPV
jgi:hypothetical protein